MIWRSKSCQFQQIQVPQDVEGKPGPGGYCYIDENLKAVRNIPAHNDASGL